MYDDRDVGDRKDYSDAIYDAEGDSPENSCRTSVRLAQAAERLPPLRAPRPFRCRA
jgi:hypothetical protein